MVEKLSIVQYRKIKNLEFDFRGINVISAQMELVKLHSFTLVATPFNQ